jgi:hypothetical protein
VIRPRRGMQVRFDWRVYANRTLLGRREPCRRAGTLELQLGRAVRGRRFRDAQGVASDGGFSARARCGGAV